MQFSLLSSKLRQRKTDKNRQGRSAARKRPAAQVRCAEALEDRCLLSFVAPVDYAPGSYPTAMAVGDFNGDAQVDLAVANYSGGDVSVLLGNGDGTFQVAVHSPATAGLGGPWSLAVGDFDSDGNLDVATTNDRDLSVLLGNGDGSFQAPQSLSLSDQIPPGDTTPLPQWPISVAVGDLNDDGALDLVATGYNGSYGYYGYYYGYGYYGFDASYVNVLLGNGNGGFGPAETQLLGTDVYPLAVAVADLNADGNDDVMTANSVGLSVLLGDGAGSVGSPIHSGNGYGMYSISVGDVDGDGNLDTVLAGTTGGLSVQKGDGQGGFTAMPSVGTASLVDSAVIGDVNGDGTLDLVAAGGTGYFGYYGYYGYYGYGYSGLREATVLLGNGSGDFAAPLTSDITTDDSVPSWIWDAALEDLNGDGLPELLALDGWSDEVVVALNDGAWDTSPPPAPASIVISDATLAEGNSGTAGAVFTVSILGDHGGVTVDYATQSGSAIDGSDFAAKAGTLTFAAGESSKTISVAVIGDTIDEYDEQFFVNLSNAAGGQIADSQGIGTILDDDDAPLVTINDVSKAEGRRNTTSLVFTVSLSEASEKWIYVDFATADGTATEADNDYVATSGTLTFAPGETTATIIVIVNGDRNKEADETFYVNLTGATDATIADSQGIGTILDDDTHGKGKKGI